jgi:carbonic anhydrase
MSVDKFIGGYRKFRDGYFRENEQFIQDLMVKGQKPSAIMIACSDSRIDPALEFNVGPGELFMVRNVAALVPPFETGGQYHGTSAALEFAVRSLEVENVIVMGHARCGGVHALMNTPRTGDFVGSWMEIAEKARSRAQAAKLPAPQAQVLCEQETVKVSLENLMTFPWVKEAVDAGKLKLHGWYFDLGRATLYVLNDQGAFVEA